VATFAYMYAVRSDGNSGRFTVSDHSPTATNVDVNLLYGNGEVGDPLSLAGSGIPNDNLYDYLGTTAASAGGGGSGTGYIIYNAIDQTYYMLTNDASTSHGTLGLLDSNGGVSNEIPCFMPGTLVRTAGGEVCIEELKIGDLVATHDGRMVLIRWIGLRAVKLSFGGESSAPIRIRAGALADNVPSRDLLVSPDHAIFVDGILIHAGALINGISIIRDPNPPASFTYYHVETDDHSLIFAENTVAETFVDNADRMSFDNWSEHEALYPEGKAIAELPYPRAKSARQIPQAIRARLRDRGIAIFGAEATAAA
jgi:Hint domain